MSLARPITTQERQTGTQATREVRLGPKWLWWVAGHRVEMEVYLELS